MSEQKDKAEPSGASAGSQPVAWWVTLPGRNFPYLSHIKDRAIFCQKDEPGSEVVPLYRSLTLTGKEREAIAWAINKTAQSYDDAEGGPIKREAMRGLLQRTK